MNAVPIVSVITTIQPVTPSAQTLAARVQECGGNLLVIGDRKGPKEYVLPSTKLFTLDEQLALPLRLATLLPQNHYARKNLGYLLAIQQHAACLYETDDDNAPLPSWSLRSREVRARTAPKTPLCNAFRAFTDGHIWPRGFPLDAIADTSTLPPPNLPEAVVMSSIQQGLADRAPDVDAIWRLVIGGDFSFDRRPSLALPPGTWCPFNSQSTWWWPPAYPLLYLPSFCSFRMTDIWRSFVAQRCLWELGEGVVFHASEVEQQRNVHDLLRDFHDEVPGYEGNRRILDILTSLSLRSGKDAVMDNMERCYRALIDAGFLTTQEEPLIAAWRADCEAAMSA